MTNDICVIYSSGGYGTFIEWCLNYFSDTNFPQDLPFNTSGNSHKFVGHLMVTMDEVKLYVNSRNILKPQTVRFHPRQKEHDDAVKNIEFIDSHFKKIIYLYSDLDTFIWNINNKFYKIWDHGWLKQNEQLINDNLTKWKVSNLDNMADWQKREFLSFFIYEQHIAETDYTLMESIRIKFPKCLFVDIKCLRDNFKNTLISMFDYCNIDIINSDKIDLIYQDWIKLQYHCNKDQLIKEIIEAIISDNSFSWHDKNLTIIDEAFIQMKLRDHGIEIKCYNLNIFPTSTEQLKPFLYAA